MAQETKPLPYKEFAEHIDEHLAALEEPGSELTLYKGRRVYKVLRSDDAPSDDPWTDYDPERLRRIILENRYDGLPGVDVEKLKRELRASRSQDSQGRPA